MKKWFIVMLAAMLVCISTGAMAMGWGRIDVPEPTYTATVTKLDKVDTTSGTAYVPAPNKLAGVGTIVYFTAKLTDADGNAVQGEIRLTDMEALYYDGEVIAAIVTGAYPAVKISYESYSALGELEYGGKPVMINGDTVKIGDLTFTRKKGVAVDVVTAGSLGDITSALGNLGMTLDDIYSGRIYMDDAALITNLGQHIQVEGVAKWYTDAATITPTLPQTGDAPTYMGIGCVGMGVVAALCARRRKKD